MNQRHKLQKIFNQLPLIDQLDLTTRAYLHFLRHHPRRAALPGTLAGGILTFSILIPIAFRR